MSERRVVITGVGIVAPNGIGKDAFWKALLEGRSGVRLIQRFDTRESPIRIAGEINGFNPLDYAEAHELKKMDRGHWYAIAASDLALADSGLDIQKEDSERIGSSIGNAVCGVESAQTESDTIWGRGPRWGSPYFAISFFPCGANGVLSIRLKIKGPILTFSNGNTSGSDAIGAAFNLIRSGRADVMFAGGTEAPLIPFLMESLSRDGLLSGRNEDPGRASRPFDRRSDGMVLAEGAGMLILEESERARQRGAHVYGELAGYANVNSTGDFFAPGIGCTGLSRAMRQALQVASLAPEDIDFVNAQGLSIPSFDGPEAESIVDVLGSKPWVSSVSSWIGNPLGALGGIQAVVSALVLDRQMVPPHAVIQNPYDQLRVTDQPVHSQPIHSIIQNSFCVMGKHSALVFKK